MLPCLVQASCICCTHRSTVVNIPKKLTAVVCSQLWLYLCNVHCVQDVLPAGAGMLSSHVCCHVAGQVLPGSSTHKQHSSAAAAEASAAPGGGNDHT